MMGRPSASPCVVPELLFKQNRMYVPAGWDRRGSTALSHCVRVIILCLVAVSLAAPANAMPPPVPRTRPAMMSPSGADAHGTRAESARLGARVAKRLDTLRHLLAKTGLDVDRLVAVAGSPSQTFSEGSGGPLVPALGRGAGRAAERAVMGDLERLRRMESVLLAMPLAAPMTEYQLNSGFGYRRDPFRRRGAIHTGLDFGGPRNAAILATAPGTVVEAGRAGAYGIMVVVDHGMGIETRYAHLSRAVVRVGERVDTGKMVGIMGRTGRATGYHLHYEIRVDGRPLNPKPFIEAGAILSPAGS